MSNISTINESTVIKYLLDRNLTLDEFKKVYLKKMDAIKKRHFTFLNELEKKQPELFDKRFLYEFLKYDLKLKGKDIPEKMHDLIKNSINSQYKIN